jgi:hypothetical protein
MAKRKQTNFDADIDEDPTEACRVGISYPWRCGIGEDARKEAARISDRAGAI